MYAKNLNSKQICDHVSLFFPKDLALEIAKFLDILFEIRYTYCGFSFYEINDMSNEIITYFLNRELGSNLVGLKMKIIMAITPSCLFDYMNKYEIRTRGDHINRLISPITNKICFH